MTAPRTPTDAELADYAGLLFLRLLCVVATVAAVARRWRR